MQMNSNEKAQRIGNAGENEVSRILSGFNRKHYIVINNVLLRKTYVQEGEIPTVQIDHVVVSKYGIFTLETKNYSGSIYGSENDKTWTVFVGNKKYQMQNPLRQNYGHSKTIQKLLDDNSVRLGIEKISFPIMPIIAFSNKTKINNIKVFEADIIHFNQIPDVILRKSQTQYLSSEQMENIAAFIKSKNIYSPEELRKHVDFILRKKEESNKTRTWNVSVGKSLERQNNNILESFTDYDDRYISSGNNASFDQKDDQELFHPFGYASYHDKTNIYKQYEQDNDKKYKKEGDSKKLLIITGVIIVLILFLLMCCCCGIDFLTIFPKAPTSSTGSSIISNVNTDTVVTSRDQIDLNMISNLRQKADEEVKNYMNSEGRDESGYKDLLTSSEYIGECFAYNEENGSEIFFIYQIINQTETIDNVNLRKYSDERPIYYYIGFRNLAIKSDGSISYDETIDKPTVQVPDFSCKSIYFANNYMFVHFGYPFVTDLYEDIESNFEETKYDPNKESIIDKYHAETLDITDYSDYVGHGSFIHAGAYIDGSGEEYNECLNMWYHGAFTDPVCVDYRIGSEYNTLSFIYAPNPSDYGDKTRLHFTIIDKDTFEVIYEGEDITSEDCGTIIVNVEDHKNIRIQISSNDYAIAHILMKKVVLSNE